MIESQRYLYHSFPRRPGVDRLKKGLNILGLIVDYGLVLAPEALHWEYPHANGTPPRPMEMAQRRICFTELAPKELAVHAETFGPFALEFDADTLKSFTALPVVYVPRSDGDHSSLGETLVIQLMDALCILDRMARVSEYIGATATGGRQNFVFGFTGGSTAAYDLDVQETARLASLTAPRHPGRCASLLRGSLACSTPQTRSPNTAAPWPTTGNASGASPAMSLGAASN